MQVVTTLTEPHFDHVISSMETHPWHMISHFKFVSPGPKADLIRLLVLKWTPLSKWFVSYDELQRFIKPTPIFMS